MRLWIPVAAVALAVVAYLLFYELSSVENQGSAPLGLANAAGMVAVVLGVIVAGMLFRRGAPPDRPPVSRNP